MESNKKSFKIIDGGLTANQLSDMELSSLMGGVECDDICPNGDAPCNVVPPCPQQQPCHLLSPHCPPDFMVQICPPDIPIPEEGPDVAGDCPPWP